MQKLTKRILKIVGKISDEVINKYKLYNYKDKNIVQSLDLYIHTLKHKKEFISSFSYENTLHKIPEIILSPNYVYYNSNKNSVVYFKKLEE